MNVLQRTILGSMIVLVAGGTGATAFAMHDAAHAAKAHTKTVKIVNDPTHFFLFSPQDITIKAGTRVIWVNKSNAPHTITSKTTGLFNKSIALGKTVSITFKKKGTFAYFCAIHPFMKGKIIVK